MSAEFPLNANTDNLAWARNNTCIETPQAINCVPAQEYFQSNNTPSLFCCPSTVISPVSVQLNVNQSAFNNYQQNNANSQNSMMLILLLLLLSNNQSNQTQSTTPTNSTTTCKPQGNTVDANTCVKGDPHFIATDGTMATDQVAIGKPFLLLENNTDQASLTGETSATNNAQKDGNGVPITIFTKEVLNLGNNTRVLMNLNGTANLVDSQGNVLSTLSNGQTVTGSDGNTATYNATTQTLSFTLNDNQGDDINGTIDTANNKALATQIASTSGNTFGGALANLLPTYTGVTVDSATGAGVFKKNASGQTQNNDDFYTSSLYNS